MSWVFKNRVFTKSGNNGNFGKSLYLVEFIDTA